MLPHHYHHHHQHHHYHYHHHHESVLPTERYSSILCVTLVALTPLTPPRLTVTSPPALSAPLPPVVPTPDPAARSSSPSPSGSSSSSYTFPHPPSLTPDSISSNVLFMCCQTVMFFVSGLLVRSLSLQQYCQFLSLRNPLCVPAEVLPMGTCVFCLVCVVVFCFGSVVFCVRVSVVPV
ncbi:hypothetical protein E2C01_038677 [Portunus trituberculatus]|uniref:Uncharacterized protein n=1 Tax=Portunus trituberculatus TaxID=210409 RepID=A0A5B7FKQ1_PORTR|nr:hypothetical protein [Portunus trituberculatus]